MNVPKLYELIPEAEVNQDALMNAIGFTDADLDANRNGYMSKEQRRLLRRKRLRIVLWPVFRAIFIGLIGLAFAIFFIQNFAASDLIGKLILILLLLGLFFVVWRDLAFVVKAWNQIKMDLYKGDVAAISGQVFPGTYVRIQGRGISWQYLGYKLEINGLEFKISQGEWSAFSNGNHRPHRIYFAPASKIILSAEQMEPART